MRFVKLYAIFVTLILIGAALIVTAHSAASPLGTKWWASWPTWLQTLGTTLFLAGSLGVIERALSRRDVLKDLTALFRLHESTVERGLAEVALNAGNYDYSHLICESEELLIVMNDARTWVSSRIDQFQRRFARKGFKTDVFLIDPEGQFAPVIASKTGYELDAQKNKINEAVTRFKEEFSRCGRVGTLRIYYLKFFPTHSIVIGMDQAVVTLYGISSGRRKVPTFCVKETNHNESFFHVLRSDVEALRKEARLHFDSTTTNAPTTTPTTSNPSAATA